MGLRIIPGGWARAFLAALCIVACGSFCSAALAQGAERPIEAYVQAIVFSGEASLLSAEARLAITNDASGRTHDFDSLQRLADRVTERLQADGHILARAYLPPQDVTEGVVEIAIAQGVVEEWVFDLGESVRIKGDRLEAIALRAAAPGQALTRQGLERALLIMGENPGVTARAALESGSTPNSTRVVVQADEGRLLSGSVSANNYGGLSTGFWQGSFNVNLNDPTSHGEQLRLSTTRSEGVGLTRLGWDFGVGSKGLRHSGDVSSMSYAVVHGNGAAAQLTGSSHSWRVGVNYPLVRSRLINRWGSVAYEQKSMQDLAAGIVTRERTVSDVRLELSGDRVDAAGTARTQWNAAVTTGDLDLTVGADPENTAGNWTKLTAEWSRMQALSRRYSLQARAGAQTSAANLDSSQKFAIGGPDGVRAYPAGEGSGDLGWRASLELSYDMPTASLPGNLQASIFVDHGWVRLYHDAPASIPTMTGRNEYTLSGAGVGLAWRSSSGATVQIRWAHAIGDNPGRTLFNTHSDGSDGNSRVWVQSSFAF